MGQEDTRFGLSLFSTKEGSPRATIATGGPRYVGYSRGASGDAYPGVGVGRCPGEEPYRGG